MVTWGKITGSSCATHSFYFFKPPWLWGSSFSYPFTAGNLCSNGWTENTVKKWNYSIISIILILSFYSIWIEIANKMPRVLPANLVFVKPAKINFQNNVECVKSVCSIYKRSDVCSQQADDRRWLILVFNKDISNRLQRIKYSLQL